MQAAQSLLRGLSPWSFSADELDNLEGFYRANGFAVLSGALAEDVLSRLELECCDAQERLLSGDLPEGYGTTRLIEEGAGQKGARFANYVVHITELSPTAYDIVHSEAVTGLVARWLGPSCWSAEAGTFGYVYQDARPGPESSYKRIGWHSDWQSSPHLPMWPATAVTVHIDQTSPANGFLRVVPGSHLWATPAPYENVNGAVVPPGSAATGGYTITPPPFEMPLRFEMVPGEVPLYAQRGDILFHDCYLWHSAAVATDMEARRRHVRGSWYGGARPQDFGEKDFVKNAAR
ncbi:MAG TPA: phytanoyl-CoA dioxygenase family protein [Acidimicrobiales bacterium]|nr:phytanoyl-CoA dioxygenase family protein [Acidimicrobiales bacterium]